ncbi:MAG: hypothetical protein ACPLQP_06430, partial [Moorellaceae bacterium]
TEGYFRAKLVIYAIIKLNQKESEQPLFDQSFLEMRRKVLEEEKREEEKWRTEALSKAKAVAKWLKENYTIIDVYLYGSLAWGALVSIPTSTSWYRALKTKSITGRCNRVRKT